MSADVPHAGANAGCVDNPNEDPGGAGTGTGDGSRVEWPDVEAEPAAATQVFGARLPLARSYVEALAGAGTERGLIGPREAGRLWTRHVLNCAGVSELIPSEARVVDIGSGAGLPGIPLALAREDLRIDLLESLLRRSTFLEEVTVALNLAEQCRVVRARAEEAAAVVGGADVVTARAVAPLGKLARWAAPLLRTGGLLLALKGFSAHDEVERDHEAMRKAGLRDIEVVAAGMSMTGEATTVVRAQRRR